MKKGLAILFALSFLLVLWANAMTHLSSITKASEGNTLNRPAGNIPDGMYTIVGESSRRCLEVPNNSCGDGIGIQTFDCDRTESSNNQKFNVVSDGSGNYTIRPVHSDLCLEVSGDALEGRTAIQQNVCVPGKVSQKWAMNQFGLNLQIRDVQSNQCMDVMSKIRDNFAPVYLHSCTDGGNQRWRLKKTTLNIEKGVLCRASPDHPEYDCSGVNDQQKQIHLGRTLTKTRCEEVCKVSKMVSCKWDGSKSGGQ